MKGKPDLKLGALWSPSLVSAEHRAGSYSLLHFAIFKVQIVTPPLPGSVPSSRGEATWVGMTVTEKRKGYHSHMIVLNDFRTQSSLPNVDGGLR